VFVAGPFQSRINVADPVLPSNATQRERVNYYTKKASWTALGAALVAVGVAAVGVFLFDDVEFFQPRYGSTALMRKALAAMNAHAPFLKLIGRVTADPAALARETIPASARGSQASASQLVSRYKRQGDQVKFHFRVDAPNGLVFATVEARHNKTTGDYDLFSLVLDIPQHRKRMVVIREFTPTARRSSPA